MRSTFLTIAAFMLFPLVTVQAQWVQPKSGDRIRITAAPYALHSQIARVLSVRSDTLFLDVAPAETLAVALASVTRLDVRTGRHRNIGRGAAIGTFSGVAAGVMLGYIAGDDPPDEWIRSSASEKAVIGAVLLAAPGMVIGALVGAITVSDRWTSVPLGVARATPSLQMGRRGTRLGVSVSF
jgi:hypothetical protein